MSYPVSLAVNPSFETGCNFDLIEMLNLLDPIVLAECIDYEQMK